MRKKSNRRKITKKDYAEIYINEAGKITITPLADNILVISRKISGQDIPAPSVYCG